MINIRLTKPQDFDSEQHLQGQKSIFHGFNSFFITNIALKRRDTNLWDHTNSYRQHMLQSKLNILFFGFDTKLLLLQSASRINTVEFHIPTAIHTLYVHNYVLSSFC